jgi:cold shock CspA family protein
MAKSQETFNKKEKEKKRLKKKQDKEQKKEERKANADKGKSFEDMLAYVDHNGNITSTPPDLSKKVEYKTEDIVIGVARQEAIDPADLIRKGVITFFNQEKGYGFIKDQSNQESIFVHINGLLQPVKENDKVSFETEMGMKGLNAIKVKII